MVRNEETIQERIDSIKYLMSLLGQIPPEKSAGVLMAEIISRQFPYITNIKDSIREPGKILPLLSHEISILEWVLCQKQY